MQPRQSAYFRRMLPSIQHTPFVILAEVSRDLGSERYKAIRSCGSLVNQKIAQSEGSLGLVMTQDIPRVGRSLALVTQEISQNGGSLVLVMTQEIHRSGWSLVSVTQEIPQSGLESRGLVPNSIELLQ